VDPDDFARLDAFEQCAVARLEPLMGPLRLTDRQGRGAPPGMHDLEADLPGGAVAAMEVTSVNESRRLQQESAATRILSSVTVPGSDFKWMVGLDATAQARYINQEHLCRLLADMEAQGVRSSNRRAGSADPFAERLEQLKLVHVYAFKAPGRGGQVIPVPDFYFGWGWDGAATNTWLTGFLTGPTAIKKLAKLGRADHAAEWHLVVMLHPVSQAGLCIPSGLVDVPESGPDDSMLPSLTPPAPLTDLWIMPVGESWKGLRWSKDSGWAVLLPVVSPVSPSTGG
jgi:hypothetical protein